MKQTLFILFISLALFLSLASCKKENVTNGDTIREELITTFEGYLMDVTCGNREIAMDKTDVVHSPQDHTVECLNFCASSGFGIMTKEQGKDTYKFVPFDENSIQLVLNVLYNTKKEKGIKINVEGVMKNGFIKLIEIKEVN